MSGAQNAIASQRHYCELRKDDVLARLLTFPNVLITAHQGFLTHEALSEIANVTADNIALIAQGKPALPSTLLTAP